MFRRLSLLIHFVYYVKEHIESNCIHCVVTTICPSHHHAGNPLYFGISKSFCHSNCGLIIPLSSFLRSKTCLYLQTVSLCLSLTLCNDTLLLELSLLSCKTRYLTLLLSLGYSKSLLFLLLPLSFSGSCFTLLLDGNSILSSLSSLCFSSNYCKVSSLLSINLGLSSLIIFNVCNGYKTTGNAILCKRRVFLTLVSTRRVSIRDNFCMS